MRCSRHQWSRSTPCLDCESERVKRELRRDVVVLHCIPAAYKLAMLDVYGAPGEERKLTHEAIAAHAYKLADAMLAERDRGTS